MEKHKRRSLRVNDVLNKEPYLSIINLTKWYEEPMFNGTVIGVGGLRLYHYRYALVKNHNIKMDRGHGLSKVLHRFFYGGHPNLEALYEQGYVKKCITTTQNLSSYLNRLVKLGVLEKFQSDDVPHYRLNEKKGLDISYTLDKIRLRSLIDNCPNEFLTEIMYNIEGIYAKRSIELIFKNRKTRK